MRRTSPKQFAAALRESTRGKKKHDIDETVRAVVGRFGVTGQIKFLGRVSQALSAILDAEQGTQRVVVHMPHCDEKRIRALTAHMSKQTGRDAELFAIHNPSLIAGAVFTVGDKRYDGSIKNRIIQLKKHLQKTR